MSPDGRAIAFIVSHEGTQDVRVRSLVSGRVSVLPGSTGAEFVFWSSDGREVGYAAEGTLRRSRLPDGPPQTIATTNGGMFGATWSGDTVLFSGAGGNSIFRVSAHGGTPATLTTIDPAKRETSHRFPLFLADGHHYVFLVRSEDEHVSGLYVADVNEPTRRRAAANIDSSFAYASGHLLFGREGTLWAQPFDPERVMVTGDPTPIAHPIFVAPAGRWAQVGASARTLAYATGDLTHPTVLRWLSRDGRELGTVGQNAHHWNPQLSPDGRQLALSRSASSGTQDLIWLTDLKRSIETNFTPGGGINGHPVWAPDGAHLAFATNVDGYWTLQVKGVRDTDARQVLPSDHVSRQPQTWVSDDTLVYQELNQNGIDLWQVRLSTPGSRTLLVGGPGDQIHAAISPDRRWLAYASNETGRYEVYVRRYGGQERWQVSATGGVRAALARGHTGAVLLPPGRRVVCRGRGVRHPVRSRARHGSLAREALGHWQWRVLALRPDRGRIAIPRQHRPGARRAAAPRRRELGAGVNEEQWCLASTWTPSPDAARAGRPEVGATRSAACGGNALCGWRARSAMRAAGRSLS